MPTNQARNALFDQENACITNILLVSFPLGLLLIGLWDLAAAHIWVQGKIKPANVDAIILGHLFFISILLPLLLCGLL
jgi:hypothetical protein